MIEKLYSAPDGVPESERLGNVLKVVGDSNVYVILGDDVTIIDTSDNENSGWIKAQLEKVIELHSVKRVLLTHLHYDHVGNLDLFPEAEVYASAEDLESFREDSGNFFLYNVSPKVTQMLKNAKELPSEIGGLKVIKVPGHTVGSVAFLDDRRKILFSGDTLFEDGIGRTDLKNSVPGEMSASVKKLRDLITQKNLKLASGHDY